MHVVHALSFQFALQRSESHGFAGSPGRPNLQSSQHVGFATRHLDRMGDARLERVGLATLHCDLRGLATLHLHGRGTLRACRFSNTTLQGRKISSLRRAGGTNARGCAFGGAPALSSADAGHRRATVALPVFQGASNALCFSTCLQNRCCVQEQVSRILPAIGKEAWSRLASFGL